MIISFYSYKGGVGRSQLCANVASYLCYQKGLRVLLMDWDFEAPGLHYFFENSVESYPEGGTLDLLDSFANLMRTNDIVVEQMFPFYNAKAFVEIANTGSANGGKIDLLPAGKYDNSYRFNVNNFDWYEFYELLDGKRYVEWLKNALRNAPYDIVLIDSRTGINDYSGICNIQLPDLNVVVMAANNQNMLGCKGVIDRIQQSEYITQGYRKGTILPILSRINVNHPNFIQWANKFCDLFHDLILPLDTELSPEFSREIFNDFYLDKTLLPDDLQFSAGENILFSSKYSQIPKNSFADRVANICSYILNIKDNNSIGLSNQIDKTTWLQWADHLVDENQLSKAATAFEKGGDTKRSIELGGTSTAYLKEGIYHYIKGDKVESLNHFQKSLELDSQNFEANFNLANVLADQKDYEQALQFYIRARKLRPDDPYVAYNMGTVYVEMDNTQQAIEHFELAIQLDPSRHESYHNLGNAYADIGEYAKAVPCYQRSIELKPDKYISFNSLGLMYIQVGNYEKAIECFQAAIKIDGTHADAFINLGFTLIQTGQPRSAEKNSKIAINLGCKDKGYLNLGHSYFMQGMVTEALEAYSISRDEHKSDEEFINELRNDIPFLANFNNSSNQLQDLMNHFKISSWNTRTN